MTNLETILTIAVWTLVASVFCYYRSLAVKQERNHNSDSDRNPSPSKSAR